MAQDTPCPTSAQVETTLGVLPRCVAHRRRRRRRNRNSNGIRPQGRTISNNHDGVSETIPLFDPSQRVTSENGRIDRVKLTCYLGTLSTLHDDDFPHYRHCLGYLENGLFNAPPDGGESNRPTLIRSSSRSRNGVPRMKPLLGGKMNFFYARSIIALSARLYLNPTEAMRFYPEISGDSDGVFETLAKPTEPRLLDRSKQNCLSALITQAQYRQNERRYFENVFREIERSCREAAETAVIPSAGIQAHEFCLKDCEVYFEFHRPNAIECLRGMAKTLNNFAEDSAIREHAPRTEANDIETNGNGESVKLRLSKTEHLIVYAKTANRLRFEVRFLKPGTNILRRRSAPDLNGIFPKFDTLRERAAERVNEILAFLQESHQIPPMTIASDWRFKREWFNAVGWNEISDEILETLRLKGRFIVRCLSADEKRVINAAKHKGLIRYVKGRRAYVPVSDAIS